MNTNQTRHAHASGGDVDFDAIIGGAWVPCRVTREALDDRLAKVPGEPLALFSQHETVIVEKARGVHAEAQAQDAQQFTAVNRLVLLAQHF
jgi:hypothetical protein